MKVLASALGVALIAAALPAELAAQWPEYKKTGEPRKPDGTACRWD